MKINPNLKEELKKYLKEKIQKESEKVVITSPYKLSQEEKDIIISKFPELREVEIEERLDPSLLAGITIKRGSKILDLSLSAKVNGLEQQLYESA